MNLNASCVVESVRQVAENVFVLGFVAPSLKHILPGQFVNIKADEGVDPLLRRPFSVYNTHGGTIEIIFNVVGRGTSILQKKRHGDVLNVLGPLGVPFLVDSPAFDTGILVAGGLGVAPMPMLTNSLKRAGKKIVTFLGSRSSGQMVDSHLDNVHHATDDGSRGFKGTVVGALAEWLLQNDSHRVKIFACGPTPMLRGVSTIARSRQILCEVSLEGPMACGFGICQGCPVEFKGSERKYGLMCKDGPVFDSRRIII